MLLSVILRWPTFIPSVMDHDESTYIIIANQWLQGGVPYVDNLDVKPPGIYFLYAIFLKILPSVWGVRFFTSLVIGISGFLLYKIHKVLFVRHIIAIACGTVYILMACAHKWSWPSNTEIFFILFSLLSFYRLITASKNIHYVVFGIFVTAGFLVKFHLVFDVLAFVIFYYYWSAQSFGRWLVNMFLAFFSFVFLLAVVYLIYAHNGYSEQLLFAMVEIPQGYANSFSFRRFLKFFSEFYISFLPMSILFIYCLYQGVRRKWLERPLLILLVSWLVLSWISISSTGKFFFHYYFQAVPVLAVFSTVAFLYRDWSHTWLWVKVVKFRVIIFFLMVFSAWFNQYNQVISKDDITRKIYEEIVYDFDRKDRIYTNDKNILYFMLGVDPPTKYTHTTVLYKQDLITAYQVDVDNEFRKIVESGIKYYVLNDNIPLRIKQDLSNFELVSSYKGNIKLYRRLR